MSRIVDEHETTGCVLYDTIMEWIYHTQLYFQHCNKQIET